MLWYFMGFIYLSILTYQDYFKKMLVDDRFNYLMIGATVMLYSIYPKNLWYLLIIIVLTILVSFLMTYFKAFAEGDLKAFLWSFIGFLIIDYNMVIFYFFMFWLVYFSYKLLWALGNKFLKTNIKYLPGYPILLISFLATSIYFWLVSL